MDLSPEVAALYCIDMAAQYAVAMYPNLPALLHPQRRKSRRSRCKDFPVETLVATHPVLHASLEMAGGALPKAVARQPDKGEESSDDSGFSSSPRGIEGVSVAERALPLAAERIQESLARELLTRTRAAPSVQDQFKYRERWTLHRAAWVVHVPRPLDRWDGLTANFDVFHVVRELYSNVLEELTVIGGLASYFHAVERVEIGVTSCARAGAASTHVLAIVTLWSVDPPLRLWKMQRRNKPAEAACPPVQPIVLMVEYEEHRQNSGGDDGGIAETDNDGLGH